MPIEFEDELGDALRATADTFQPGDPRALVGDGHALGRRLRRRRTALITTGVAAFAVIAGGGVMAGTLAKGGGTQGAPAAAPAHPRPTATATHKSVPPVSGAQLADLFRTMLPHGSVTVERSNGTEEGSPYVDLTFDDGHGPAEVQLSIQSIGSQPSSCPDPEINPGTSCSITRVHGGTLMIYKGWEYPDHRDGTKDWLGSFVNAAGNEIDVSEYNSPAEKGSPPSRVDPPLTGAQLKSIVTDSRWKRVLDALPPASGGFVKSAGKPSTTFAPGTNGAAKGGTGKAG